MFIVIGKTLGLVGPVQTLWVRNMHWIENNGPTIDLISSNMV